MADEQSTQTPPPGNTGEQTPPGETGGQGANADRTFTQADLDRIVQERLARERQKFSDYEQIKERAARLDEIEAANKSELERAQERAAKLEADNKALADRNRETALRAAVIAESAKRNIIDPDAAVALLDRSALEFGDDGTPTNVAETVESLLQARPYLAAGGGARPNGADQGARSGGPKQLSEADLRTMSAEEIVKAQNEGRLDSVLKGA